MKNIIYIFISFFFIIILDKIILYIDKKIYYNSYYRKKIIKKYKNISQKNLEEKDNERRWYLIHAIINTYITLITFPDVISVLSDPLNAVGYEYNTLPMCVIIGLHLFHIYISKNSMTYIDWIHHIINAFFVGFVTIIYYKGLLINYTNFFMCGLPGSLDYYCLAFNKYGLIKRITEKRVNVFQNNWIRCPGIITACFIGYLNYIYRGNELKHNILLIFLLLVFNFTNCVYFAERVTKNYGMHLGLKK